jgi:hypothetical protein
MNSNNIRQDCYSQVTSDLVLACRSRLQTKRFELRIMEPIFPKSRAVLGTYWTELFRVGMPSKEGEGAVELLGEHGAGEFV